MKVTYDKAKLSRAVKLSSYLPKDNHYPISSFLRLNQQELTVVDLYTMLWINCGSSADSDGAVLLPRTELNSFLGSKLGNNLKVQVTSDDGKREVTLPGIGSMNLKATYCPDLKDFPADQTFEPEYSGEVASRWFLERLRYVLPYSAVEISRPVLNGVTLNHTGMAAADGFRLGFVKTDQLQFLPEGQSFILPLQIAKILPKLFAGRPTIKISFGHGRALFENDDIRLITILIQGNFPDYLKLVPENSHQVEFSGPLMYQTLELVNDLDSSIIRLYFEKEKHRCRLCGQLNDDLHYDLLVGCLATDNCKVALNYGYFATAVKPFSYVRMSVGAFTDPVKIQGDIADLTVVIMPMFVQWGANEK